MKRYMALLLMIGAALSLPMLAGCQTLTDTPGQNAVRVDHAMTTDWLQVPDQAESVLLLNRPTQLSDKPVPLQ
ncbi:MAG: hypothetical protein M0Z50_10975 [Planctomycetia bacterium]|jgi:hypothetical protein|nr:hypothetical protein [Planctomycetia bacterium]